MPTFAGITKKLLGCLKLTYRQEPDFRVNYSKKELTLKNSSQKVYRSYLYGFNSQERDDEVSGKGNSYSAEFWQYSPRLGRRWNLDPVVKPYRSPYDAFSNNPIIMVDPNGADDYFNADGSYNKQMSQQHKKDGQKIWVLSANGKTLLSDMPLKSESDKNVVLRIFGMYARKLGITNIKLGDEPTSKDAVAYTDSKKGQVYINTIDGRLHKATSNYYDLMSSLEHEKIHRDNDKNDGDGLGHAEVYLNQTKGDYFRGTTSEYKDAIANSVMFSLVEELDYFNIRKDVDSYLKRFNDQNEKIIGKIEYLGKGAFPNYDKFAFKANGKNVTYTADKAGTINREKKTESNPKY